MDRQRLESVIEPRHDKTNKMSVRPAKTQITLGIRPVCSDSSLSAWRKLGSLATHWAHSEGSDQTGRMPRLIWVFAGRTLTLLVLSYCGSLYVYQYMPVCSAEHRYVEQCHWEWVFSVRTLKRKILILSYTNINWVLHQCIMQTEIAHSNSHRRQHFYFRFDWLPSQHSFCT